MAQVILQQVRKVYANGYEAVKSIDLAIHDGEFMVLVGPSGCAKSTTLRMIAGLEDITSGDLFIGARKVNALPPSKRNVAMVFQDSLSDTYTSSPSIFTGYVGTGCVAGGLVGLPVRRSKHEPCSQHSMVWL